MGAVVGWVTARQSVPIQTLRTWEQVISHGTDERASADVTLVGTRASSCPGLTTRVLMEEVEVGGCGALSKGHRQCPRH